MWKLYIFSENVWNSWDESFAIRIPACKRAGIILILAYDLFIIILSPLKGTRKNLPITHITNQVTYKRGYSEYSQTKMENVPPITTFIPITFVTTQMN